MPTLLSPVAIQQFKDNNGNPLAGGQLYTYAAGTSTPQPSYTDATGTSANSNPVILNSRGEAPIWLTPGQVYKLVLLDASSVLIWSADQVPGGFVDITAGLAASGGAGLVGFLQAGSGAVARTLQSKGRESVSVSDFTGADATGATTSTAAFTSAGSGASNIEVNVPAGIWNLATNPAPTGNVTWVIHAGATFTGAGVLPGQIVSYAAYAPSWVSTIFNGAYSYMPSASTDQAYHKTGGIGFMAAGRGTGTIGTNASISYSSVQYNNSTTGASSWCFYGSTIADSSNSNSTTQTMELDISRTSTSVGATYGLAINAGGEAANQVGKGYLFASVDAALLIGQNNIGGYSNVNFNKGIVFGPNSLNANNTAMSLQSGHALRWFDVTGLNQFGAVYCSATAVAQAQSINLSPYGTLFQNSANQTILQLNNSVSNAANYLQFNAAAALVGPSIAASGSDTNIDLTFSPKGSGVLNINAILSATVGTNVGYLPVKINGTLYKLLIQNT